jgi:F0F1-type ATP synthase assembly protein I
MEGDQGMIDKDKDKEKSIPRQIFEASTVGIYLVVATVVGGAMGFGLDYLLGTSYLKFVFFFLGIIAGFREVFRVARKGDKD